MEWIVDTRPTVGIILVPVDARVVGRRVVGGGACRLVARELVIHEVRKPVLRVVRQVTFADPRVAGQAADVVLVVLCGVVHAQVHTETTEIGMKYK